VTGFLSLVHRRPEKLQVRVLWKFVALAGYTVHICDLAAGFRCIICLYAFLTCAFLLFMIWQLMSSFGKLEGSSIYFLKTHMPIFLRDVLLAIFGTVIHCNTAPVVT